MGEAFCLGVLLTTSCVLLCGDVSIKPARLIKMQLMIILFQLISLSLAQANTQSVRSVILSASPTRSLAFFN